MLRKLYRLTVLFLIKFVLYCLHDLFRENANSKKRNFSYVPFVSSKQNGISIEHSRKITSSILIIDLTKPSKFFEKAKDKPFKKSDEFGSTKILREKEKRCDQQLETTRKLSDQQIHELCDESKKLIAEMKNEQKAWKDDRAAEAREMQSVWTKELNTYHRTFNDRYTKLMKGYNEICDIFKHKPLNNSGNGNVLVQQSNFSSVNTNRITSFLPLILVANFRGSSIQPPPTRQEQHLNNHGSERKQLNK